VGFLSRLFGKSEYAPDQFAELMLSVIRRTS
jgi:hypothetical protein